MRLRVARPPRSPTSPPSAETAQAPATDVHWEAAIFVLHSFTDMQLEAVEPVKRLISAWVQLVTRVHVPIESLTLFGSRSNYYHVPQSDLDIVLQLPSEIESRTHGTLLEIALFRWMRHHESRPDGVTHLNDAT